jgi:tetratricopeptide (TPR) repeat protein
MLTPAQMIDVMTKSSVTYLVTGAPDDSVVRFATAHLFATQREYTPIPHITNHGDNTNISTWDWPGLTQETAQKAEKDFSANDMKAARADYEQILSVSPDCYLAVANIGDCFNTLGNRDSAIAYYDKAIKMSKIDYLPYYYKGDVLYRAGRYDEARQAMVEVLTLRPRYKNALHQLRNMPNLGVTVHDSLFAPRSYAVKSGKDISLVITSDSTQSEWMIYAIGKGLWLGEPWHRDSLTGSTQMSWTMAHEVECIAALLASYEKDRKAHPKPEMEELESIASDDLLNAFILYEITSRLDEDVMLTVSDEARADVRKYVEKYILPKS